MSYGTERRWPRPLRLPVSALFAAVSLIVVATAVSELLLEAYAERRVTRSLERDGSGVRVDISARPAVRLLLGRADRVDVRVGELRPRRRDGGDGRGLGDLLASTAATDALDVRIGTVVQGRLMLHGVRLLKRGNRLTAQASVTRRAVARALPSSLALTTGAGADALRLTATARALGRTVTADATISASDGRLVVVPRGGVLAALTLTLFADPRVAIDGMRAAAAGDGYQLSAEGHLT
jgi:hypothetical protein